MWFHCSAQVMHGSNPHAASMRLTAQRRLVRAAVLLSVMPATALAQSALVHLQGEPGRREAYFANFAIVSDRTPVEQLLGPLVVRELETVIVYESADKPEFSALRLQFECVVKHAYDGKTIPPQPAFDAPVRVRSGEGGWSLRRQDLRTEPLPAGEWRSAASPVLLKLHKMACNDEVLRGAMVKAARQNNDLAVFRREVRRIGLPEDLQLVGQQMATEYLDFSWWVLWAGATRPDPSGKWSTRPSAQQLREAQAQMEQIQGQVRALAAQMQPGLEAKTELLRAELDFPQAAARVRGDRKMSRNERLMLSAWEGKTETDIGAALGAPLVSSAGELRFLSYGKEFDNRVVVGNSKGAAWQEGVFEQCNLQFVLWAPGPRQPMRVVDVRIWTQSTQLGQLMYACSGLLEAPR